MTGRAALAYGLTLAVAPLLPGVATRVRALLTSRRGPPLLQLYFELAKLVGKHTVVGSVTTPLFRWGPAAGLVAVLFAAALLPLDGHSALGGFPADFMLFAGLLALSRLLVILAAFDTASSLEGMGASRDAMVAAFSEGGLFMAFAALALATGQHSLSGMLGRPIAAASSAAFPSLVMTGIGCFVLLLAECSRGPVDDPATHLELTMIHEVAILDHSGPALAWLQLASALRFALFGALVSGAVAPRGALSAPAALAALPVALLGVAAAVGVVEGLMARLRMNRVPQLLVAATALIGFAVILLLVQR